MQLLERFKERFGQEPVKVKKVRARDIQKNLRAIQDRIDALHGIIDDTTREMNAIDRNTESGQAKYLRMSDELKMLNETMSALQDEMKSEYDALKKYRDSRFSIQPERAVIIGGIMFLGTFMIALERENPKALKLATFLLKLFPLHL